MRHVRVCVCVFAYANGSTKMCRTTLCVCVLHARARLFDPSRCELMISVRETMLNDVFSAAVSRCASRRYLVRCFWKHKATAPAIDTVSPHKTNPTIYAT